jgi:hypothetical protein
MSISSDHFVLSQLKTLSIPCCVLMAIIFFLVACQRSNSVSGVWREIDERNEMSTVSSDEISQAQSPTSALYELNLGQYGDRVAGVSVRYQRPSTDVLAYFDRADRCSCSFVVQGLIEQLDNPQEDRLLFVSNGLTFSLYTPSQSDEQNGLCPNLANECKRIFDLEQIDGGNQLEGQTWCLESPEETRRSVRFESINGIPEDICEAQ